jgi:hypothetical protein
MITSWPGPWQDIDDKTRRMLTTCSQFSQRPTVSLSYSYTGPPLPPDWCAWGSPTITQCDRWTPGRYPSVALGDTRHSLSRSVDTPMPILDHHGHACRGQFPRSQLPMSRAACVCGSVCVSANKILECCIVDRWGNPGDCHTLERPPQCLLACGSLHAFAFLFELSVGLLWQFVVCWWMCVCELVVVCLYVFVWLSVRPCVCMLL